MHTFHAIIVYLLELYDNRVSYLVGLPSIQIGFGLENGADFDILM
jgi:hypothetical protein